MKSFSVASVHTRAPPNHRNIHHLVFPWEQIILKVNVHECGKTNQHIHSHHQSLTGTNSHLHFHIIHSHHSLWMPITRFCPWHWLQRCHKDGDTETWELHNHLLICGSNSLKAQDSLFVLKPTDQIRDDGIPDNPTCSSVCLFVRSEASRKTPRIEVQSLCLSSRCEGVLKSCVLLRRVCDYQKNMW